MIYDTSGDPLLSASLGLTSSESRTVEFKLDCKSGFELSCGSVSGLVVEARRGTSGGWTDIETTPIDLGTWDGTVQTFQVRVTAPSVASRDRKIFTLTVGPS